jgi:hypothetical protein
MNIRIFVHATDITGEIGITLEQISLLNKTGLLDKSKEVNICTHYNEKSYEDLMNALCTHNNVVFNHFDESYKEWYEYTTCLELQKQCNESDDEFYALYLHNKGAFTRTVGNYNWRKYMEYFCVEKWHECVEKLDEGYDLVGAAFKDYCVGNFFWTKSSYIKRCQQLVEPPEVDFKPQMINQPHLRFDLEPWHASGNPKWYELHPGQPQRWYLPPEAYREDLKNSFVYSTV